MIEIAVPGEMRRWTRTKQRAGRRVAFVPTMGYLHEGHLSLVRRARPANDHAIPWSFVNPPQVVPAADHAKDTPHMPPGPAMLEEGSNQLARPP